MTACYLLLALACADPRADWADPPREFAPMPFWFWNDALDHDQIRAQIADFEAHGVYGFCIHPRLGLPLDTGWRSPKLYAAMAVAIEEAARRDMFVILYDEGMYPSGSSAGQVVERDPSFAARGLALQRLAAGAEPQLEPGWELIEVREVDGERVALYDRPSGGVIRGLHWTDEESPQRRESAPLAADLLNPAAVDCYVELVYDDFARLFGAHFGSTVVGIFTDEPSLLGRGPARGLAEGSAAAYRRIVARWGPAAGDDLFALLGAGESPAGGRLWRAALDELLAETYYRRLGEWCAAHGVALMGHPAESTEAGPLRWFGVPGQDLVWRYVTPNESALVGGHSTMAKVAASAAYHLDRRRNSNELYGAYGHELTEAETYWLAYWCLVRGQNWLLPHAFYYSMRGPRRDERPPDVGPNAVWWPRYQAYADTVRRLSWLNTDSRPACDLAVITTTTDAPDALVRPLYEAQRDFHYLDERLLVERGQVSAAGLTLGNHTYPAVVLGGAPLTPTTEAWLAANPLGARLLDPAGDLVAQLDALAPPPVRLSPRTPSVRARLLTKDGWHWLQLFAEAVAPVETVRCAVELGAGLPQTGWQRCDLVSGELTPIDLVAPVELGGWEMLVLAAPSDGG